MLENSIYRSHIIGKIGEELATKFLIKSGYKILDRNYNCNFGELDIVAKDKNEICIIEVKTRTSQKFGTPSLAVNYLKRKHLIKTCEHYLINKHLKSKNIRFDIIEIILNYKNKTYKLNHIKQVI